MSVPGPTVGAEAWGAQVSRLAALWLLGLGLQLGLVAWWTGELTYSLDDAYIHLALAEGLWQGHHGINPGEASAPSSSILWPYLLAPLTPLGAWGPLLLNLLAGLGCIGLIPRLTRLIGEAPPAWLGPALLVSLDLWALPLMGMEHTLQVWLALLTVVGVVEVAARRPAPGWWWWALWLGPLVRYEHLALSGPALILAWTRAGSLGARGRVGLVGLGIGLGLGLGSWRLASLGLGLMPSSILVKSAVVHTGGRLGALLQNVWLHAYDLQGLLVMVATVGLGGLGLRWFRRRPGLEGGWEIASFGAVAGLGHLLAGHSGWYTRYTAYIWATLLVVGLSLLPRALPALRSFARAEPRAMRIVGLIVLVLHGPQLWAAATTPIACSNIDEQQRQIHVFATEALGGPIAVNDIGYAAWQNDRYVLDLVGLGSLEALAHRGRWSGPAWMDALAEAHGAHAAVIYDHIAPSLPEDWVLLANLSLSRPCITPAADTIGFYATSPAYVPEIQAALDRLEQRLPPRLRLERR